MPRPERWHCERRPEPAWKCQRSPLQELRYAREAMVGMHCLQILGAALGRCSYLHTT